MITILDGKQTSENILNDIKEKVENSNIKMKLVVISVGDDPASKVYIRNKKNACEKVGIDFENIRLETNESSEELYQDLLDIVTCLNDDNSVTGMIIQKPIMGLNKEHEDLLFAKINPNKDVDVFNHLNEVELYLGNNDLLPCTPQGIFTLLNEYKIDVEGKHVVIIGRSNIVGKPLALAMLNKNATVTICHSKTKNLKEITQIADILVTAIGKSKLIDHNYISSKCECVIDVGMNRDENNKLCGDCNFEDITNWWNEYQLNEEKYITPVPSGVGPMTVASLIQNILKLN